MRVLMLALFVFAIPALAERCLPDSEAIDAIVEIRQSPCFGELDCVKAQLKQIEPLLDSGPDEPLLYRLRQDLLLEADLTSRKALAADYQAHPTLQSDSSAYLQASVLLDADGLRDVKSANPWALVDLLRHQPGSQGGALADADERENLLEDFFRRCPDAAELLLAEAYRLDISPRWPVWETVRRSLLSTAPPSWDALDDLVIRAGLLQAGEEDPAARLIAELDDLAGDHEHAADYWRYRARIHYLARDPEATIAANERIRQIDPCRQLSPGLRRLPGPFDDPDADWLEQVGNEIVECPPARDTWQMWLLTAVHFPELVRTDVVDHMRSALGERPFGTRTDDLDRLVNMFDIRIGRRTDAAWEQLAAHFQQAVERFEREPPGEDRAWLAFGLISDALSLARLAVTEDHSGQYARWRERANALLLAHRASLIEIDADDLMIPDLQARMSELAWLSARAEGRHADAVIHALSARADGWPWVEMDEVAATWRKAGGGDPAFERLLAAWGLDLPANWRGWRRLGEPMEAFELNDLEGRTWTVSELDGSRTLVNLWATWCGPCLQELPKVQAIYERYRDDPRFRVLTINLDSDNAVARRMVERQGWDFPVLFGGHAVPAFERMTIPRNWLVDGEGIRQWEQTGFSAEIARHWVEDVSSLLEGMN